MSKSPPPDPTPTTTIQSDQTSGGIDYTKSISTANSQSSTTAHRSSPIHVSDFLFTDDDDDAEAMADPTTIIHATTDEPTTDPTFIHATTTNRMIDPSGIYLLWIEYQSSHWDSVRLNLWS